MFQYRKRVSPHAAPKDLVDQGLSKEFQYRKRVSPHAARKLILVGICMVVSIPQKGLPPMRLVDNVLMKNAVSLFQYRKRVSPHAAHYCQMAPPQEGWFQYRKRVSPHAAPPFREGCDTRPQRVSKKHYPLTMFPVIPCHNTIILPISKKIR